MAQHDYVLADQVGSALLTDVDNVLSAIATLNSGTAEPTSTFAYMYWYDTATDILKQRNAGNSVWLELFKFDQTNNLFKVDFDKATNIASATTTDLGVANGNFAHVTGTTTITGFGTIKAGVHRWLTFDGVLLLTHNATSLILPSGANITTAAGDTLLAISEGSGNWRVLFFEPAAGLTPVSDFQEFTGSGTYNKPAGAVVVYVEAWSAGGSGGGGDAVEAGGGGGGGAYVSVYFDAADVGATETVTIGAGGSSQSTNSNGQQGGQVTFGSLLTVSGGGGGGVAASSGGGGGGGGGSLGAGSVGTAQGGAGGPPNEGAASSTVGNPGIFGGASGGGDDGGHDGGESVLSGAGGGGSAPSNGGNGGDSVWGGAGGGGGVITATPGNGGTSIHGGDGGAGAVDAANATAGTQPGGGGGGSETGNSGAGGNGLIRVWSW